jgi:hypothetical protein
MTAGDWNVTGPGPIRPSTLRVRLHRERRREGLRLLTLEMPETAIDAAIARGFLRPQDSTQAWSVIQSVYATQLSERALNWLTDNAVITTEQRDNPVAILRCISDWLEGARMKGKNGKARAHAVPLVEDVLAVLDALPHFDRGGFLFSTTAGASPVWMGSKVKARMDARVLRTLRALARRRSEDPKKVTLAPWTNHDIRRSVRSQLSRLKVTEEAREAVLALHGGDLGARCRGQRRNDRRLRRLPADPCLHLQTVPRGLGGPGRRRLPAARSGADEGR